MIGRDLVFRVILASCLALAIGGCEKASYEEQKMLPDREAVQALVHQAFGTKHKVVAIEPDGKMYRLYIGYHDYRIDNIYLRADKQTLMRAELVSPPSKLQSQANQKHASDREAYRDSVNEALAKAGHKPSEANQKQRIEKIAEGVIPPVLPRVNDAPDLSKLYQDLKGAEFVIDGAGERVLYVFDDYACPACRQAAEYLHSLPPELNLEIRHVPVGVLGPQSLALASYVIDSPSMTEREERGKAVRLDVNKILDHINSKRIKLSDVAVTSAMKNFHHLQKAGRRGTPTFVYLTENGVRASTANSESKLRAIIDRITREQG